MLLLLILATHADTNTAFAGAADAAGSVQSQVPRSKHCASLDDRFVA
jgi:hypothetical protein